MAYNQIPTILSLLTPEYQQAHGAEDVSRGVNARVAVAVAVLLAGRLHAPLRSGGHAGADQSAFIFVVTPQLVQISTGVARNFVTNINVGREFRMDGDVPRLGADVPRWYGETIGFWDKDALITWTSNIQGWMVHGKFEFSSKLQTVEIYTPVRDAQRASSRPSARSDLL